MSERSLRGKAAIIGVGETKYYKRGQSPDTEFKLALEAILTACDDAGISPKEIEGFSAFSNESSNPNRMATALGLPELKFSAMAWSGGGGGGSAAAASAAAGIAGGMADVVVVFRSLTQGAQRLGGAGYAGSVSTDAHYRTSYGVISPAQQYVMRVVRYMHDHGIGQEALRAIAMASYHHAQTNPDAVMYGKPLTAEAYDASRWIVEPFHLYDCCMENDGAAAYVMVSAERAKTAKRKPVYLLGAAQGSEFRNQAAALNAPLLGSAGFTTVAPRLYEMAKVRPQDLDVIQVYENFTGGVLLAMAEHGLFKPEEANAVLTLENLTVGGRLPLNTSGGNLAHCYMHGMEHHIEAVRQLRGEARNQVAGAKRALVVSGPMVSPTSSMILGSEEAL